MSVLTQDYGKYRQQELSDVSEEMTRFIPRFLFALGAANSRQSSLAGSYNTDDSVVQMLNYSVRWWDDFSGFTINTKRRDGKHIEFGLIGSHITNGWGSHLRNDQCQLFTRKELENMSIMHIRNPQWQRDIDDLLFECASLADSFLSVWIPGITWENKVCLCQSQIHSHISKINTATICDNHHGRYICAECAKHLSLEVMAMPDEPKRNKTEREKLTPRMRWEVLDKYACTCQGCGRKPPEVKVHVDHKMPIAQGGKTEMDNLHVLCEACNLGKSDKMPSQKTMELWSMAA